MAYLGCVLYATWQGIYRNWEFPSCHLGFSYRQAFQVNLVKFKFPAKPDELVKNYRCYFATYICIIYTKYVVIWRKLKQYHSAFVHSLLTTLYEESL